MPHKNISMCVHLDIYVCVYVYMNNVCIYVCTSIWLLHEQANLYSQSRSEWKYSKTLNFLVILLWWVYSILDIVKNVVRKTIDNSTCKVGQNNSECYYIPSADTLAAALILCSLR